MLKNVKQKSALIISLGIIFIIIGGIWFLSDFRDVAPGRMDGFVACLKDKGAVFYGAFWCPHCQNQKAMFGSSKNLLPYTECSEPDGQSQTPVCRDKKIESYPTWEFKDGSRLTGEIALETLAEKTGCVLTPQ